MGGWPQSMSEVSGTDRAERSGLGQVPVTSELTRPGALRRQVATHTSVLMASAVAALWDVPLMSSGFCFSWRLPGSLGRWH